MVFRGKRRNTEPLLNIRMSTPKEGEDIDLFYIEYKAPTFTYGEANHYWCGVYSDIKFPTLFLEDHNNSQCFVIFNMSCTVSSHRISRYKCKSNHYS